MSPTAAVVNEEVFDVLVRLELKKALRLQYPLSLLSIRVQAGAATNGENERVSQFARIAAAVLRSTDVVVVARAPAGPLLHVLLVDANHEHLPGVIARIREEIGQHRFRIGNDEVCAALAIGAASFPTTASTLEDLVARAMSGAET